MSRLPDSKYVCPLCHCADTLATHNDRLRTYECCVRCRLTFVPPRDFLSPADERALYDLHENDPTDVRYRAFLSRLFHPMQQRLTPGCEGLDFGSGPGPTLSVMFEEVGHRVELYDCFYAADASVFHRQYDFITASEVVEHLHDPRGQLDRLWRCLRPGGLLGIMTQIVPTASPFGDWHYIRDPTHVCFFAEATHEWLADYWTAELTRVDGNVALYQKPS